MGCPRTFILPHFANYAENISYVSELLTDNPNIYIDFSARLDELGRQQLQPERCVGVGSEPDEYLTINEHHPDSQGLEPVEIEQPVEVGYVAPSIPVFQQRRLQLLAGDLRQQRDARTDDVVDERLRSPRGHRAVGCQVAGLIPDHRVGCGAAVVRHRVIPQADVSAVAPQISG